MGGAELHAVPSGSIDFREEDDPACLARIRELAGRLGDFSRDPFQRVKEKSPPRPSEDIYRLMPLDPSQEYDVRRIFECIFDDHELIEHKAERGRTLLCGYARLGGRSVGVVANSVVPKITVITGGSYGAGNYALCGKAYDPRFLFAWPNSRYAVMGAEQAARTLLQLRIRQLQKEGREIDDQGREELRETIEQNYTGQMDPRYSAARLWVDAIIEPHRTRDALKLALEVASLNPDIPPLRTGVLQV